jgi:hypothetical protein
MKYTHVPNGIPFGNIYSKGYFDLLTLQRGVTGSARIAKTPYVVE